jgi:hypothetical protein
VDARSGEVQVDRAPGQDWVHNEHAETGKPGSFSDENESRGTPVSNGPVHVDRLVGMGMVAFWWQNAPTSGCSGGHKLSAFGSPQRDTRRAGQPLRVAAARLGRRSLHLWFASYTTVIPQTGSQVPSLARASPHHLADCPSRRSPLGGKARWQKRSVFPARRMRRGLQF